MQGLTWEDAEFFFPESSACWDRDVPDAPDDIDIIAWDESLLMVLWGDGPYYMAIWCDGHWRVCDLGAQTLSFKSSAFMDTGFVYAPYVPVQVIMPQDLSSRRLRARWHVEREQDLDAFANLEALVPGLLRED